jgi:hypothetical protein
MITRIAALIRELFTRHDGTSIHVANTGNAVATNGGTAVSGYAGPATGRVKVTGTGDAVSTDGGTAVTGIRRTR